MGSDPKKPGLNDLVIDASDLANFLEDLEEGQLKGLRTEGEGTAEAIKEIIDNQPTLGAKLGITPEDIQELLDTSDKLRRIDIFYPTIAKLEERIRETRAKLVDARARRIGSIVKLVRMRNEQKEHKGVLARYEKADHCNSAAAQKAAQTKRKRADEQKE